MRILLVEDDEILRGALAAGLAQAGHRVDQATSMEQADHLWRVQPFDAVILDLGLPRHAGPDSAMGNGLTVLHAARTRRDRTPVLVLTGRDQVAQRVDGLNAGADDYLGKPFDLGEVEARLRAMVRRTIGSDDWTQVAQLQLDRRARRFSIAGAPLDLPGREFQVLWELMSPPGHVLSKRQLSDKLSDFEHALGGNALEAFVSRLRRKLAGSGATIRALRGLGYLLEVAGPPR